MEKFKIRNFALAATHQTSRTGLDSQEKQLWQRFLEGDIVAFQTLMTDYFRILFRYGAKFSRDREFIKDCIQDLFLYLWEHRSSLRSDVAIKPYLLVSLRRYMHRNLPDTTFSEEFSEGKVNAFDLLFSVEEQYIYEETEVKRTQQMKRLLETLPHRQKEVIYLKFFQELTRDEIAQVMQIAPQTVSNLLQLAIKQLRHLIRIGSITMFYIGLVFSYFFR